MRYKFASKESIPGHLQIGHHMIRLKFRDGGGHVISLPNKGGDFIHEESDAKINEWVDLIIEYQDGKVLIDVNGFSHTYTDENATMGESDRFTFKSSDGPNQALLFDYVRLWEVNG